MPQHLENLPPRILFFRDVINKLLVQAFQKKQISMKWLFNQA
jgi:hypothetical protein